MPPSIAAAYVSARRRPTLDDIDRSAIGDALNDAGNAVLLNLLDDDAYNALTTLYPQNRLFRSRVAMERHGFGRGEYQYFAYPLSDLIAQLRTSLYPPLATIVNRQNEAMDINVHYPAKYADFLRCCHEAGQLRTTPPMLRYGPGDYNCLHQDLYGEHVFPLRVTILLSEPSVNFSGGELVMTGQRPRMRSRPEVMPLRKDDAVVFAVYHRSVQDTRGTYRVSMRHGVSRLCSGQRHTVGIILHDALQPTHHDHRRSVCRSLTR